MTLRPRGMRLVSTEEASATVREQLVGTPVCDELAVDCGLLRSCLWALSGGDRPVHSLRLLNLALESSPDAVITGGENDSEIRLRLRGSLNELADAGDVVSLANGRWLPAPTREVRLGTSDGARLLVGGFPTSLLPAELSAKIRHRGAFRRMIGGDLAKDLALRAEPFDSWVGAGPVDVKAWTASVLEGEFEAFTEPNDSQQFRVYAPQSARPGAPQFKRWFDRPEKLSGRFLGRRELSFGMRQYRAVDLVNGRVARLMGLKLATGDVRRLMYGLDALAGNPVLVEYDMRDDDFVLVLASEIPGPEQRFFAALGELSFPPEKYYPRTWRFPRLYASEVHSRLTSLGVRLFKRSQAKTQQ